MKKKSLLICLLLISGLSFGQWTWQNPLPQGNSLNSVHFPDANTGYAVSDYGSILKTTNGGTTWTVKSNGTNNNLCSVYFTNSNTGYAVGVYGTIIKTINGGNTWTTLSSGTTQYLRSIYFYDVNTGYAVGSNGTILKTTNGGNTWTTLSSGTIEYLFSVYFTDAYTGYAAGWTGTIMKTINGGATWTTLSSGTTQILYSIYFTDVNTGYVVGGGGSILKTTNRGTTWTEISVGINADLYSVYFTDANTGYAAGYEYYYGGSGWSLDATIYKTINGGTTWTTLYFGTYSSLASIYFTDVNTGCVVGSGGAILRTTNGGTTWTEISVGINADLYSVYFTDANTGYAAGYEYYNGWNGTIYKTINGGTTWTAVTNGTNNGLYSIYFPDASTGYAAGEHGTIMKTINGGNTWTTLSSGSNYPLYSIYFTDTDIGYAVGGNNSDGGIILKTINGGNTWTTLTSGTMTYLFSVCFPDANTGYAVGGDYENGVIIKTTDAGLTWTILSTGTNVSLSSVYFTNVNTGYAVGAHGTILKTINGGTTWTITSNLTSNQLKSVFFPNASTGYAFAPGTISNDGMLKTIDGGETWTHESCITNLVASIYFPDANTGYAVGWGGTIIKTVTGLNLTGNLSFGNVTINHPTQRNYTIGNATNTSITVSSITYPNGFSGNWSGGAIAAGTSKNVLVTFAPSVVQTYSGVVTVNSNSGSEIITLPINGSGVQSNPGLTISGNLDFGTVQQGSVDDRPLFLYNNTSSLITIDNIIPTPTGVFGAIMQNGTTILPNHSLPISVFFYPPDLLTYNTTFTVTSDAPNGNVTFTATGKGGSNPISWIGFYTKPENNSEVNEQVLDEHFITQSTTNPIKICADGSKATTVEFINNDPGINIESIIFNMASDPLGNNTDYTGWFVTKDYTREGNKVIAKYTHPKYLNISGLYRKDTIRVINSVNGNIIYKQAVQIYRTPVILVHGIWGDFTGMLPLYGALLNSGKYNNTLLRVTDYSGTNACSFFSNSLIIKNEINSSFQGLHLLKYSAGKVDIVAHSMGGILSRIYLQSNDCQNGARSNCYRGDIHKLITLNTPHSGTQIANFLLSNSIGAWLARTTLEWNDQRWDQGAVDDLRCDSPAILSLNGSSLNNHIVPCHAIQTETNVIAFDKYAANENSLTHVIADARIQSAQNFNNQVFADTKNDLIVPANSQKGGLNDFSYFEDVMHTASPDNSSVINTVIILLDENPVNSVYFNQNVTGFDPAQITPTFYKTEALETDPYSGPKTGLVTITSPTIGFSCSEGDTVQIDVSSSPNVNHLLVLINNKNTGTALFDTVANSAAFYYSVPKNIAGDIKIMAIGYDSTGFVDMDTLDIFTNLTAPLDSMTFFKENIDIQLGQSVPITLFGYFHDLTLRNISQLYGTEYDFSDSTIVSMNPGNVLQGLAIGQTILHAANQNKHVYVYVTVDNLSQQLGNINIPDGTNQCYNATQFLEVAGNGTTFIVEPGGNATMIAGQSIAYLPGTIVQSGGYLWGYIAPGGPWCQTPSMPAVLTKDAEIQESIKQSSFKVYPNPTAGNFILELTGEADQVKVDIFGIWGEKVLSKVLTGELKHEFSLSGRPVGVYFIRVVSGDKAETVKLIKQ